MKQFLTRNRAVFAILFLSITFFSAFIWLGYFYAKKGTLYDATIIGSKVANLNYVTGSGDVSKITSPIMEGLVKTSIDFEDSTPDSADYASSNAYAISLLEESNPEIANQVKNIYAPLTYSLIDDDGTIINESYQPSGSSFFSLGATSEIVTNEDFTSFRFYIDPNSYWENGIKVKALDFAYGISKQLNFSNGTAGSYMLFDYSALKGISACYTSQTNEDISPEVDNDSNELNGFFGLTFACNDIFAIADHPTTFNSSESLSSGIVVYDDPAKIEQSYLQFNLTTGNEIFPTMTSSTSYFPLSVQWWHEELGYDSLALNFGTSSNKFLSNGPFTIKMFDSSYGFTLEKNPYYRYKDLMPLETMQYRVVNEATTQISMFQNNYASYIQGSDSNSRIISENQKVNKYVSNSYSSPTTRFLLFNLHSEQDVSKSPAAKYYRDPNFRRSIFYSLDRTAYQSFAGKNNTAPSSIFTPSRMQTFDYKNNTYDYVDLASNVSYKNKGTISTKQADLMLEYYNLAERDEILNEPGRTPKDSIDYNKNYLLSNYYWNVFEDDMNKLGIKVPTTSDPVILSYLTINGDDDPVYKALQEGLTNKELLLGNKVKIVANTQTSATFWDTYYSATGYDISSLKWNPDFLDPWSSISIFNEEQLNRSGNATASWTFWNGSDYTIPEGLYRDPELARELFDDGLSAFYDGTSNIDPSSINLLINEDQPFLNEAKDYVDELVKYAIDDNGFGEDRDPEEFFNTSGNHKLTNGIDKSKHFTYFNDVSKKLTSYILFDLLIKDGAAAITVHNETSNSSPSRMFLMGDPIIGYPTFNIAVDYTRPNKNSYWNDIL